MLRSGAASSSAARTRTGRHGEVEVGKGLDDQVVQQQEYEIPTHHGEPTLSFELDEAASTTTSSSSSTRPPLTAYPDNCQRENPSSSGIHYQHQHQRQLSAPPNNLFPVGSRRVDGASASSLSPTRSSIHYQRHLRHGSHDMPLTGDGRVAAAASPPRSGGSGGWRTGTPRSVNERNMPAGGISSVETTPKSVTPATTTAQTRFGGFLATSMSVLTSRMTGQQSQQPRTPASPVQIADDELYHLDIEAALYPSPSSSSVPSSPYSDRAGSGGVGDAFSPAAYKNLQLTAAGLLHKMQDAYRQRTIALHEMQGEKEVQRDEVEELEVRISHTKTQLEKMAARAAEQESAIQQLVAELRAEKLERREEREKLMRLAGSVAAGGNTADEETEDLGVDDEQERRRRNRWRESVDNTDVESVASESIFSRSRSPTATISTTTEIESGGGMMDAPSRSATIKLSHPVHPVPQQEQQQQPPQQTAFQRLVKGIGTATAAREGAAGSLGTGVSGSRDSNVAWDTASVLRAENIALKVRVTQLEAVVEGALDVVNGVGIF